MWVKKISFSKKNDQRPTQKGRFLSVLKEQIREKDENDGQRSYPSDEEPDKTK